MSVRKGAVYLALGLGFVSLGLLSYSSILGTFFVSDDFELIDMVRRNGPLGLWTTRGSGFFRPMISLSLFANYRRFGLSPVGYHLTNVILHSLNAFMVFAAASLMGLGSGLSRPASREVYVLAGLAFLTFPSHTEAVTWISGRTDVIATFFCLISLVTYLLYRRGSQKLYLLPSAMLFACALLSKESVLAYPLVVVGYEVCRRPVESTGMHGLWSRLGLSAMYLGVVLAYLIARYLVIGSVVGGYGISVHLAMDVPHMLRSVNFFVLRTFLPPMSPEVWRAIFAVEKVALLPVVVLAVVAYWSGRRAGLFKHPPRVLAFVGFGFFASLIPVMNLAISGDLRRERLLYLPSVFSCMFLAYVIVRVLQTARYRRAAAACLLVVYSLLLVRSNAIWRVAGNLAENIVEGLAGLGDQGALFVVNLPDNLRGAYVFRNGFASALALFYGDGGYRDVTVISRHDIGAPSDGVSIVETSQDTYHIELSNSSVSFVHLNVSDGESPSSQYYELDNVAPDSYDLRFKPLAPQERRLLYYSAGNIVAY